MAGVFSHFCGMLTEMSQSPILYKIEASSSASEAVLENGQ
jgi:hypothetical protein